MPLRTELLLQHGWGFDASAWDAWHQIIPEHFSLHSLDRGYFRTANEIQSFSRQADQHLLVTHSLGLHLCPPVMISQASLLVIISGFQNFHPQPEVARCHSQKAIRRMKEKLQSEPQELLANFYAKCHLPAIQTQAALSPINVGKLIADLDLLNDNTFDLSALSGVKKILLLHGDQDAIVAVQKSKDLERQLPQSSLRILANAGHCLPFNQAQWCISAILETLDPNDSSIANLSIPAGKK